jgi:hypothetical protein
MSKGLGKVQRAILTFCEREGEAWPLDLLCVEIYRDGDTFTRAQKSAVGRAIKRMKLPGAWTFERIRGDGRWWLYDPCNMDSTLEARQFVPYEDHEREASIYVRDAIRWRDASEAERIDIKIERIKDDQVMSGLAQYCPSDAEQRRRERWEKRNRERRGAQRIEDEARLVELERRKAALKED